MISLLILFCSITGCGQNDEMQSGVQFVNFNEEFQLGVREKAIIAGNGTGEVTDSLFVEMTSIEDTRCPEGAVCITGGAAKIALKLSNGQKSQDSEMCIGTDCSYLDRHSNAVPIDTVTFNLDNNIYSLIFEEATPYPKADGNKKIERADKAILKVIR